MVIGSAVRSFVRRMARAGRSSAVLPLEGRESLAQRLLTATIGRAVPELPDLTIVADAFHAALAGRRDRAPRRRVRSPCAARRPSWRRSSASGSRRSGGAASSCSSSSSATAIVVNPMLTGRFQLAAPGDKLPAEDGGRPGFGPRDGATPRDAAAWTRRRSLAAGRRCARRRSAIATRPRWARSTSLPAGVDRAGAGPGTRAGPGRRRSRR